MLKNFFNQPNALGRLVIVLLLAGGVVFAGAFNGFVVQTQASSCCGSDAGALIVSSNCNCVGTGCGECSCDRNTKPACPDNASCKGTDECSCDDRICGTSSKCNGRCE